MNIPEKCPKCGAAFRSKQLESYACDSRFEEDDDGWFLAQSYHCLATQRDQLAERVRRLEEAADAMAKAYEEIIFDRHDAAILESYRKVRGNNDIHHISPSAGWRVAPRATQARQGDKGRCYV